MSYTLPSGNGLVFSFSEQPAFNPPGGKALTLSFASTSRESLPLAMRGSASLAVFGLASLYVPAYLSALATLNVTLTTLLHSVGDLMLAAIGRVSLATRSVPPTAPRGLGMKMTVITDPKRPDLVIDQFLRLWYWGLPSAVRVAYQVDDQPEQQPATTWENPGQTQPAILRIAGAEIPGDGRTHRVTVSAWQQVGVATSPRASVSEYLSTPDVRPTAVPEWCGAELLRQATPYLADLSRLRWRHPGAVGLFAKFMKGGKTQIAHLGVADHQETEFLAEGVALLMGRTFALANVYFGVAAVARNQYGPITWAVRPVEIKGYEDINTPLPLNPDRVTRQEIGRTALGTDVLATLTAQLGASAPGNLETIVNRVHAKLFLRIKDVIRQGGTVELADLGTFRANWSASGRSVSFVPSLGFKVGTAYGKPLTDAQARGIP
ncbi:MAG: hypothetical protein KAX64_05260 [Chromatiaceae bacterium]|nr:hypothetical protein [Chromatiaceae bacterium]MBP8197951.1 hypothetical protein [Chromatiaceae bacterium]